MGGGIFGGGGGGMVGGGLTGSIGGLYGGAMGASGAVPGYNRIAGYGGQALGAMTGGAIGGPVGAALGANVGGNPMGGLPGLAGNGVGNGFGIGDTLQGYADSAGLSPKKAIGALDQIGGMANSMRGEMNNVNKGMDAAGATYGKAMQSATDTANKGIQQNTNTYVGGQQGLAGQAASAANQSSDYYKGSVQPHMQQLQNRATQNAGQAMSLKDAGDVNNNVQQGVRGLYNQEGQAQQDKYEQQARGVGRQGLADAGVLSALGAQAMQGQMGSTPMTGGQMAAMQGANMSRAGQAYGRAQQQMQSLRDQGMGRNMDMRSQGINQGFNQSAQQYDRGQGAQGLALGMTQAGQDANNSQQSMQQGFRGEQGGYQGNIYGAQQGATGQIHQNNMGMAGTNYGIAQDSGARQMGAINAQYQPQMAAQGQKANIYGQHSTGMMGMFGNFAQALGDAIPG